MNNANNRIKTIFIAICCLTITTLSCLLAVTTWLSIKNIKQSDLKAFNTVHEVLDREIITPYKNLTLLTEVGYFDDILTNKTITERNIRAKLLEISELLKTDIVVVSEEKSMQYRSYESSKASESSWYQKFKTTNSDLKLALGGVKSPTLYIDLKVKRDDKLLGAISFGKQIKDITSQLEKLNISTGVQVFILDEAENILVSSHNATSLITLNNIKNNNPWWYINFNSIKSLKTANLGLKQNYVTFEDDVYMLKEIKLVNSKALILLPYQELFERALLNYLMINLAVTLLILITFYIIYSIVKVIIKRLSIEAKLDSLTGLPNRRGLTEYWKKLTLQHPIVTAAIIDIDNFKLFNDKYGHIAGDTAIKHVAQILKENFSKNSFTCRIGGEEFVILIPKHDTLSLNNIVKTIEESLFTYENKTYSITISLGAVITDLSNSKIPLMQIIKEADEAMYHSKKGGKNKATIIDLAQKQRD